MAAVITPGAKGLSSNPGRGERGKVAGTIIRYRSNHRPTSKLTPVNPITAA
jgi:hypothetical protein